MFALKMWKIQKRMKGDIRCSQVPARGRDSCCRVPWPLPGPTCSPAWWHTPSARAELARIGSCPGSACTSQWLPRPWRSGSCFCVLLSSPLSLYHSICVLCRPSLWTTSYFVFYIVDLGLVCLSQWNVSSVKREGHVTEVSLGLASAWNIVGA